MSYVITPPAAVSVPVAGGGDFPVHRIYCVGRNYAEHAQEMGFTGREPPFFFLKPADTVVVVNAGETGRMPYPTLTQNLHHEIELVVAIGQGGRGIKAADAMKHIFGYAVGLDMTRRDLQLAARDQGRPWDWGKAFDHSAVIAPLVPISRVASLDTGHIWLAVNGQVRQEAYLSQLIWSVPEIVAILSQSMRLEPGDLVMTGTPAGVGAVVPGDVITGGIDGLAEIRTPIGPTQ